MKKQTFVFSDFPIGSLFVTGCSSSLYLKVSEKEGREIVSGKLVAPASMRICKVAKAKDLRKAAKELTSADIFGKKLVPKSTSFK